MLLRRLLARNRPRLPLRPGAVSAVSAAASASASVSASAVRTTASAVRTTASAVRTAVRTAASSARASAAAPLPPRPKPPPDSEIEESFLKGSGPGGQKINKTSSAVQLRHVPTGIVVKSQATRSRSQNRAHARQLLAQRLDLLRNGDESRAARVGGVKKRRADSAAKKSRRKYRRLDEERARQLRPQEEDADDDDDDATAPGCGGESPAACAAPADKAGRRNTSQTP